MGGAKGRTAKTGRILISYLPFVAMTMYLLFLCWVPSPSFIETTPAVEDSNRPSMQLDSKSTTRNTLMVDKLDIDMAEFAYNEQKGERNPKAELNEEFAKYGANWPCFWGETAVGKC